MSTTITVRDESASGKITNQVQFEIPAERITVRELIRSRVFQEVKDINIRLAGEEDAPYNGLVVPGDHESQLNGERRRQPVHWQRQFECAAEAFQRGRILILVDDSQCESLDEEIIITSTTAVSFLRLTILTGG